MSDGNRAERYTLSSAKGIRVYKAGILQKSYAEMIQDAGATASELRAPKQASTNPLGQKVKGSRVRCFVINAKNQPSERVVQTIAKLVQGDHGKATSAHLSARDKLVVINAREARVIEGRSQRVGRLLWAAGIKPSPVRAPAHIKNEDVLQRAVMKHFGPGSRHEIKGLHVYAGQDHPFSGLEVEKVELPRPPVAIKHGRAAVRKGKSVRYAHR